MNVESKLPRRMRKTYGCIPKGTLGRGPRVGGIQALTLAPEWAFSLFISHWISQYCCFPRRKALCRILGQVHSCGQGELCWSCCCSLRALSHSPHHRWNLLLVNIANAALELTVEGKLTEPKSHRRYRQDWVGMVGLCLFGFLPPVLLRGCPDASVTQLTFIPINPAEMLWKV